MSGINLAGFLQTLWQDGTKHAPVHDFIDGFKLLQLSQTFFSIKKFGCCILRDLVGISCSVQRNTTNFNESLEVP